MKAMTRGKYSQYNPPASGLTRAERTLVNSYQRIIDDILDLKQDVPVSEIIRQFR